MTKPTQLLDDFAKQTITVAAQALHEKDLIIKNLQQQITGLQKQIYCLITTSPGELRREVRELQQKLANCTCPKEVKNA